MSEFATIETTASGNFDNKKSWGGLHKHMEHDPELNHKNEYLNTEESQSKSKYNYHHVLIDYDKWTQEKFGAFVKEHDEKMRDKSRRFGSVKRFLRVDDFGRRRATQPSQNFMEKLSNKEDYKKFEKQLVKKLQHYKWTSGKEKGQILTEKEAKEVTLETIRNGFIKYADGFNQRNDNVKMFEYYIHVDEEGSPHLHSRVMPYVDKGLTKTGKHKKPSWSLNTALMTQYHTKKRSSKRNLSRFRDQEDNALIDCMNAELERRLNIHHAFKLIRKTDIDETLETGESHEVYKAKHKAIDKLNNEISAKQDESTQLDKNNENKREEKRELRNTTARLNKKLHGQKIYNRKTKQYESKGGLENKVADASTKLDIINSQITDATTTLNAINNKIEDARKAQKQAEQDKDDTVNTITQNAIKNAQKAQKHYIQRLNEREQAISKREHDVKEIGNNVFERESKLYKLKKRFYSGFYNYNIVTQQDMMTAEKGFRRAKKEKHFVRRYFKNFVRGAIAVISDDESVSDISNLLEDYQIENVNQPTQPTQITQPKIRQMYPKQQDEDLNI